MTRHEAVALFGGTFDPPHRGHVAVAVAARDQLPVDRVLVMPAGDPYHKPVRTPAVHRLAMTRLAFEGVDGIDVDDREVRREGPTYTVDTVETLPGRPYLVLGPEAFVALPTWHRYDDLRARVRLVVVPRPGWATPPEADEQLELTPVDLSSRRIRAQLAAGEDVDAALAPEVLDYIRREGLYTAGSDPA